MRSLLCSTETEVARRHQKHWEKQKKLDVAQSRVFETRGTDSDHASGYSSPHFSIATID